MIKHYVTEIRLVKLDRLKEYEDINSIRLKELKEKIGSDIILKFATIIGKNINIVLDGGLRFNILKELECRRIPVVYVDYNSSDIEVQSWRDNQILTKKDIIKAGLSEKKLSPKTSKQYDKSWR